VEPEVCCRCVDASLRRGVFNKLKYPSSLPFTLLYTLVELINVACRVIVRLPKVSTAAGDVAYSKMVCLPLSIFWVTLCYQQQHPDHQCPGQSQKS
jgi:hypothetical protein